MKKTPPTERIPSGYERPSLSSLLIYYIRILLLGFVYMVLVHLFLSPDGLLYRVAVWVWAVSFALLWLLYFPIKYWKHRYKLEGDSLYVASGVIYTRFHHIRLPLIQLVSVTRSPLQYLFGVSTLCVCTAGTRTYVCNIPSAKAAMLASLLSPAPGEGSGGLAGGKGGAI